MKQRRTKVSDAKTIYRKCFCGDTTKPAIMMDFDAESEKIEGVWHTVYKCRNCNALIVGPSQQALLDAYEVRKAAYEADKTAYEARKAARLDD